MKNTDLHAFKTDETNTKKAVIHEKMYFIRCFPCAVFCLSSSEQEQLSRHSSIFEHMPLSLLNTAVNINTVLFKPRFTHRAARGLMFDQALAGVNKNIFLTVFVQLLTRFDGTYEKSHNILDL